VDSMVSITSLSVESLPPPLTPFPFLHDFERAAEGNEFVLRVDFGGGR